MRKRGEIYLISVRTFDYKNVIVKFIFEDQCYEWITSSHWKKSSEITYMHYREKFNASFNDLGFDNYQTNKIASNVRRVR